ncbi:hypothetical protein [Wolbachia endosymbiont of Nomada leucophthalma]|nr:hypothetical protein [Wolbachia endosymbiont of Nomada leucophthalma]
MSGHCRHKGTSVSYLNDIIGGAALTIVIPLTSSGMTVISKHELL